MGGKWEGKKGGIGEKRAGNGRERGEELEKKEKKIEKKSGEICICENFVVNLQPITNWGGLSNKGVWSKQQIGGLSYKGVWSNQKIANNKH